jgi:UDP-N-acetylmuramoylalanine--D-glutamate ligase
VTIYNDNNATTPEATVRALESFDGQHVTLICGGSDKGIPFTVLVETIRAKDVSVILLPGTGSDKLAAELNDVGVIFTQASTMHEAVSVAMAQTEDGVILLSPACASFGLFKNEYDRNDQFLAAVATV